MTESEAIEVLDNIWDFAMPEDDDKGDVLEMAVSEGINALEEIKQLHAIGTVSEFREAMFFKKYFMELYGEGLEVANWHQNGDLEPLDNFIDEAFEWGKEKERGEHE